MESFFRKYTDKPVFMMIGHGSRNQFRSIVELRKVISKISSKIPQESFLLYFGDSPNPKKPDIGYAFQLLTELRPDIQVIMIQISEAKPWGFPPFVDKKNVFFHDDFPSKGDCKWGGFKKTRTNKILPCSNTKQWIKIHKLLPEGISNVFVLGGGEITLQEISYAKKLHIPIDYYPLERRYQGDGQTKTRKQDTLSKRIGVTYKMK
jgi:hypothetical protein